jgi:uncharacterized protein (TIGR03437 family)
MKAKILPEQTLPRQPDFMIPRFALLAGLAFSCSVSYAAIRARQILQVPSGPMQTIDYVTTDSAGSFIATGHNDNGAFIDKQDSSGNLVFTFANFGSYPFGAVADANGDVYWIGASGSPAFPFPFTTFILGSPPAGSVLGFVVKFRGADGSIVWATALGAMVPSTIAVDANGRATVAGIASATQGLTTPGAYSFASVAPANPVEIVQLSADGGLVFAATFGGNTVEGSNAGVCRKSPAFIDLSCPLTEVAAVLIDPQDHIWIAGSTNTTDIPLTATAYTSKCVCGNYSSDGYLAELSADGSSLLYATYVPGINAEGIDAGTSISAATIDSEGNVWVAGSAPDAGPIVDDAQTDGLLLEYDPVANQIVNGARLISGETTAFTNIALGPNGIVAFAGNSFFSAAGGAPPNAFVGTYNGSVPYQLVYLPPNAVGTGLAFTPAGAFVVSGTASVATVLNESDDTSPNILFLTNSAVPGAAVGQLSPGEIVSIFGTNLGPAIPAQGTAAGLTPYPSQLAGFQVLIDGIAAPLLYVSESQINAVVPFGTIGSDSVQLVVVNQLDTSNPAELEIVSATPGVFTTQNESQGYPVAAAVNQDGTINSETNPASPGSIVSIFSTGLGTLSPLPPDGTLVSASPLPTLNQQALLGSGDQFLDILYAGPAPDEVAGAMQVNFRLPATTTGTAPIIMFVQNWLSEYFTVWVSGT